MIAYLATIVDNINFGTYLQAYATAKKISERGYDITFVDYKRPYLSSLHEIKKNLKNSQWSFFRKIFYAMSIIALEPLMRWNLKRFLVKRVKKTKQCKNLTDVQSAVKKADILITGSDQVWNTSHNHGIDEVFFWTGIKGRKYSYAASIGIEHFPEDYKEEIFSRLSQYEAISVREAQGISALNEIGIKNSVQVLDPTLLLTGKDWEQAQKSNFEKKDSYLLVYSVESKRNETVKIQAQKIAQERGLKIYVVCPSFKLNKDWNADKIYNFASVDLFLALFANADFVVVSSFHGTAFSINFNKEFVTVSPGAFNSRVNSLLSLVGLTNRYVSGDLLSSASLLPIDYNEVNKILDAERRKSEYFLDLIK